MLYLFGLTLVFLVELVADLKVFELFVAIIGLLPTCLFWVILVFT